MQQVLWFIYLENLESFEFWVFWVTSYVGQI